MYSLKELRQRKHLTQRELSKILQISASAIGMYEQGRREPDHETLNKIADFFDVPTDVLLGRCPLEEKSIGELVREYKPSIVSSPSHEDALNNIKERLDSGQMELPATVTPDVYQTTSGLTPREERDIESDLEDMMNSMASAAYEGNTDADEDVEALKATLKAAMIQAKKVAKKKYTPKKYRRD